MHLVETESFRDVIARAVVFREDCPPLKNLGVLEVGFTHASGEWCFIRPAPRFSFVFVTISGRGLVVCDDSWREVGHETAYIMPAGAGHGYRVAPGAADWHYAWVKFDDTSKFPELFTSDKPLVASAASYSLNAANRGLIAEFERGNDPQLAGMWCDLIQASLLRLIQPQKVDPRIASLWAYVNERLAEPWDIESMARQAHLSREHLRRLCQRYYGSSPHQRLTALRLRRGCELLTVTNETLYAIATSVGFSNAFSFSQAFKHALGLSPSKYRERARLRAAPQGIA